MNAFFVFLFYCVIFFCACVLGFFLTEFFFRAELFPALSVVSNFDVWDNKCGDEYKVIIDDEGQK